MSLSAVPAAPEAPSGVDGLAPLRFPPELRLTPEQFALVYAENREAVFARCRRQPGRDHAHRT
jgi:hypothetical protein